MCSVLVIVFWWKIANGPSAVSGDYMYFTRKDTPRNWKDFNRAAIFRTNSLLLCEHDRKCTTESDCRRVDCRWIHRDDCAMSARRRIAPGWISGLAAPALGALVSAYQPPNNSAGYSAYRPRANYTQCVQTLLSQPPIKLERRWVIYNTDRARERIRACAIVVVGRLHCTLTTMLSFASFFLFCVWLRRRQRWQGLAYATCWRRKANRNGVSKHVRSLSLIRYATHTNTHISYIVPVLCDF